MMDFIGGRGKLTVRDFGSFVATTLEKYFR